MSTTGLSASTSPWIDAGVVSLGLAARPSAREVREAVAAMPTGRDVADLVGWTRQVGASTPLPGSGATRHVWELLATVGSHDLVAARVLEPHLDALAILAEAGGKADPDIDGSQHSWGVWAAEGPGMRLEANPAGNGWVLDGRKPWCSLAGQVTGGLVTAWIDERQRGLFAVDTRHPGFEADGSGWRPVGLGEVVTSSVSMTGVTARAVGGPGWYLRRPGFAWGGLGVAAVWYGGAVGVAARLAASVSSREPDQVALMHLGEIDARLAGARASLLEAAGEVDAGRAVGAAGEVLAARVRQTVASAVDEVLGRTARALGPGPLSHDPTHSRRVTDLMLYVRQHHGERDAAQLGKMITSGRGA